MHVSIPSHAPLIAAFIRVVAAKQGVQGGDSAAWNRSLPSLYALQLQRILEAQLMAATTAAGAVPGRRRAPAPPLKQGQSSDQLKLRFLTADRNYETIKQLARKGKCWADQSAGPCLTLHSPMVFFAV